MARIVLATFGSLGDLHPFIAIALELATLGHEPVLAASESYRERISELGLGFAPLSPDARQWEHDTELFARAMDLRSGSMYLVEHLVLPSVEPNARELLAACDGAAALVSHGFVFASGAVAEALGIPRVAISLQPVVLLSAQDPSILPAAIGLSEWMRDKPWLARAAHGLGRAVTRGKLAPVDRLRHRLGLPRRDRNLIFDSWDGAAVHLACFSPWLAARQPDWPAGTLQPGFAFYDGAGGLDDALASFLAAGEPPIVFTLGSAAVHVAGAFYEQAFAAARQLGRRAVLLVGQDAAQPPRATHPDVHVADYARFSLLFPRAAAVVHSGGIGTTAQTMRAGVPMLITPWSHDQPDNAARARRAGIARVLPRDQVSATALSRELETLLADTGLARRAAELGACVRAEHGARDAALAIAACVPTRGAAASPGAMDRSGGRACAPASR